MMSDEITNAMGPRATRLPKIAHPQKDGEQPEHPMNSDWETKEDKFQHGGGG